MVEVVCEISLSVNGTGRMPGCRSAECVTGGETCG